MRPDPSTGVDPDRDREADGRIPVSVVTGFLGCGKTTFIIRILRDPAFVRTVVIVNEFGDVALDHDLIASADESVLTSTTGCLCCAVQSDLGRTLRELLQRRDAGAIEYDRILIETSGLSDPVPMLQVMMTDSSVLANHRLTGIVTMVDPLHGEQTLREHVEARHQVALADRILISKTDLRVPSDRLMGLLDELNPRAPRMTTLDAAPRDLFATLGIPPLGRIDRLPRQLGHGEIDTFTMIRERPIPALALTLLLQAIAEHCGSRMLRLKGLVAVEELDGQPAVIHGVRHVMSPPEFLDHWPSEDHGTRVVFIGKAVPRHFPSRLLDAIEEEVRDTASGETGPRTTQEGHDGLMI